MKTNINPIHNEPDLVARVERLEAELRRVLDAHDQPPHVMADQESTAATLQFRLTDCELTTRITNLMAEKGMLDRPVTPGEVAAICRLVSEGAEADRKAERSPTIRVRMVPDEPDDESGKEALETVMRPAALKNRLRTIPNCEVFFDLHLKRPRVLILSTFGHQDEIRQILGEFGVCPDRRRTAPAYATRAASCKLRMTVLLPEDWRTSSRYF